QVKGSEGSADAPEPPPDGLDMDAWNRWETYRHDIRKPIKPASVLAAQRKLAGFGTSQSAVVEQSIASGWQGLFELNSSTPQRMPQTKFERMQEQLRNA